MKNLRIQYTYTFPYLILAFKKLLQYIFKEKRYTIPRVVNRVFKNCTRVCVNLQYICNIKFFVIVALTKVARSSKKFKSKTRSSVANKFKLVQAVLGPDPSL